MPKILQYLSNVVPSNWYYIALKEIMIKGGGIEFIWKPTLILVCMLVCFLTLSIKKYKTTII